jgi:hypothetical protein
MVEALKADDFRPHIGSNYSVQTADGTNVDLQLTEVTDHGSPGTDTGAPPEARLDQFSLVLTGPVEPLLTQQIYELKGPDAQAVELFIVPMGPDATGEMMQYHIAFA